MADDKQIELVIRAKNLTDEAFKKVQAAVRSIDADSQRTTRQGTSDWGKWFATIGGGVAAGNLLSDAFKRVGRELVNIPNQLLELGARGADVRDVKGAFEGLTASVGQTSEAMIGQLRSAFGNTVADFDLMKTANEGLSKGVKFTADDMGTLGKAARIMADRVGGDAKQSFDSLITGIAEGREKTLKQLPLNFQNIETAVKAYADSIDTEVSKLTEAQKQEALRQAVLQESKRLIGEAGEIENDFADKVAAGAAWVRNHTDALAESIAQHGPMIAGLGGMAQAAATLSPLLGMTGLAGSAGALAGVLLSPVGLVAALGAVAVAFTQIKVGEIQAQANAMAEASTILKGAVTDAREAAEIVKAYRAAQSGLRGETVLTKDALGGTVAPTLAVAEAYQKGAAAAGQLKAGVQSLTLEGFGPGKSTTASFTEVVRKLEAEMRALPPSVKAEIDAMRLLGKTDDEVRAKFGLTEAKLKILDRLTKDYAKGQKDLATEAAEVVKRGKDAAESQAKAEDILHRAMLALRDYVKEHRELKALLADLPIRQNTFADSVEHTQEKLKEYSAAGLAGTSAIDQASEALEEHIDRWQKARDAVFDFGDKLARIGDSAASILGGTLGDAISHITEGWRRASGAAADYMKAAQSGDRLGQAAAIAEGAAAVWQAAGAKGNRWKAVGGGAASGAKMGTAIMPGWGTAIGAAAGAIAGWVRSAGQGREAVEDFVNGTYGSFEVLREKLNTVPNGDGLWVQLTQKVGKNNIQQAQAAIEAVTNAFAKQEDQIRKNGQTAIDAAQAEVVAQQKVIDEIAGRREESARKIADLTKRIDAEAEEAERGIQERLDREERDREVEKLKAIEAEEKAARERQAELMERQTKAVQDLADALKKLTETTWRVPIKLDVDSSDLPSGESPDPSASHARGAYIREDHVAQVHAGEIIGPQDFMQRLVERALVNTRVAGGRGGTVIVQLGTREVARELMPEIADEVKRLRLVG